VKLTGNDHDLNFKYSYVDTAGRGVNVYVIGIFFSLTISPASTHRTQQILVSISNTLPLRDVPPGGRPLARTRTRTDMATGLTAPVPLFLGRMV